MKDCPFYGMAILQWPAAFKSAVQWNVVPNPGSNQCGLITGAHAPCSMEVKDHMIPSWRLCVRNPALNGTGPNVL